MDFSNRNAQPGQTPRPSAFPAVGNTNTARPSDRLPDVKKSKWAKIVYGLSFAAVVVLIIASLGLLIFGKVDSQDRYVNKDQYQAVFLNSGQVYFGKIKALNGQYLNLQDIYYLQTANNNNTSGSNTNVSLVKLGCELHGPYDQMVINNSQITFWENLKSDGQVAKAIATFQKDNPSGQKCSNTAPQGTQGSNVQGGTAPAAQNSTEAGTTNATTNSNKATPTTPSTTKP